MSIVSPSTDAFVDLNTKESTIVPWGLAETGPADIEYIP